MTPKARLDAAMDRPIEQGQSFCTESWSVWLGRFPDLKTVYARIAGEPRDLAEPIVRERLIASETRVQRHGRRLLSSHGT